MGQFMKTPVIIDACKLTVDLLDPATDRPDWMRRIILERMAGTEKFIVTANDGAFIVPVDFWLIKDERDQFTSCSQETFENTYSPVARVIVKLPPPDEGEDT